MNKKSSPAVHLRWPDEWVTAYHRLRRTWSVASAGVAGALIIGGLLLSTDLVVGLTVVAFVPPLAIGMVSVTVLVKRSLQRSNFGLVSRRAPNGEASTTVAPYLKSWEISRVLVSSLFVLVLATAPVTALMTADEGWRYTQVILVSMLGPIGAIALLPYVFGNLLNGGKRMGVELTPAGVYHRIGPGRTFYRWEDIRDIRPLSRGPYFIALTGDHMARSSDELQPGETWIAQFGRYRQSMSRIGAANLAMNPASAFHALRYYHGRPERRAELGTDAAIERIRAGRFGD